MASQEDDNKLESKSNINKEQERNFINVYKKFEYILKSKNEPFSKKIESLIEIWKSLGQCNQENSDVGYIIQIMDWAKLHTLNIVLTGKWKMFKADFEVKLLNEVEKTQNELMKISDVFSKKFQKLADVIKNPWDDPILANLLHDSNAVIGQDEIDFFCVETAYLVSVRLKKLCESQCEDLALNLVTAFMNCYNLSQTQNFSLNATKTHILFCFDIHIALLYKYNRKSDIVELFKKLSLEEGLQLIKRFAKKRVKISKVWRNYPEITFLASQVFVTAAVTKSIAENGTILKDLLNVWTIFSMEHSMIDKVEVSVRRIIQAATAAQHIYICCEVIHEKFGLKLRTFTIELYIRALTTDMNNLESQKNENDQVKVEETTKRLADGFQNLADILKDNLQVSRECALTAFSLNPTLERFRKIEELAKLSGFNVLDTGQIWECKLHPPVTSEDEICWICSRCGNWMCKPNLDLRLTTNFALNEALNFETLGISPQLCDDLAVVLNGPRYHLLSWLLQWEDLHRLCEMYLNDLERTKNLVTELKFVDIDYSMFATVKREPIDELSGIERGYESFLNTEEKLVNIIENDGSSSNSSNSGNSNSSSSNSNPEQLELLPQSKSDPNTLKTLRMFRHNNFKRNKQSTASTNNTNMITDQSHYDNWYAQHLNQNKNGNKSVREFLLNNINDSKLKAEKRLHDNSRHEQANIEQSTPSSLVSSDHLLNTMITYEWARITSEMKTSKSDSPTTYTTLESSYIESKKLSPSPQTPSSISDMLGGTKTEYSRQTVENRLQMNGNFCKNEYQFNNGEDAISSPSKDFPSFHKIPPPPSHYITSRHPPQMNGTGPLNNEQSLFFPERNGEEDAKSNLKRFIKSRNNQIVTGKKIKLEDVIEEKFNETQQKIEDDTSKNANSCLSTIEAFGTRKTNFDGNVLSNTESNCDGKADSKLKEKGIYHLGNHENTENIRKSSDNGCIESRKLMKSNSNKELKIILHRLSDAVIKSFIPTYNDVSTCPGQCDCSFENRKKTNGKSHKAICCKYKISSLNHSNNVYEKLHYDKYSLRKKQNSDRHKSSERHDSDINKRKTGSSKNVKKFNSAGNKQKKLGSVSDKLKKLKKDCTNKNKNFFPAKKNKNDDDNNNKNSDFLKKYPNSNMNPRVVLERLPLDSHYVRSVLSNVPGLNDYEMIRPGNTDQIVNVVQISGGRSTPSVPGQNTQASTQITPHIQRIGQPRSDKPEHNPNADLTTTIPATITTTTTTTTMATSNVVKTSTSQSPTLINILSQQIIRPGQSNCVRSRSSPLINILSQQIIRPAAGQSNKTASNSQLSDAQKTTSTDNTDSEENSNVVAVKSGNSKGASPQGTILQFICKSTLPKFQQAFGKSVYQTNSENTGTSTTTTTSPGTETTMTLSDAKKTPVKNTSVNIQPIQGSVIYTRQMPVGQTINLIPPTRGQVFRIATSNSQEISLVKDTVIHSKMSALLAAALQGKQKPLETQNSDGEVNDESNKGNGGPSRPTLVQNARIVKPVLQIPSNVIRSSPQSNLSSTTLEQLREFDMVYKQIKERSSTNTPSSESTSVTESNEVNSTSSTSPSITAPPQRISVTYLNQGQGTKYTQLSPVVVVSNYCNLQAAASPALSVTSQGSSSPCVTPAPTNPPPTTTTAVLPKVSSSSSASSSSSTASSKSSKGKTVKNTTTQASKASPVPKPQQKPQEDEHTTQRIFDILAEYAEQLRNSPDLNNKPAPRRRSNPPTNSNQNSKRKKNSSSKKSGHCQGSSGVVGNTSGGGSLISEIDIEDHRTVGSEDSSCGVVQISLQDDEQQQLTGGSSTTNNSTSISTTETTNESSNTNSRQLILTDSGNAQAPRNLIIADSSVGEALKMPNTAVLVPGNYIMPVSMVKGGQQIAVVSGGSKILATVPARSGPNMLLFQSFLNQSRNKTGVPTVKYSTIQPISGISSQNLSGVSGQPPVILPPNSQHLTTVTLGQPLQLKKMDETTELLLTISQSQAKEKAENTCKEMSSCATTCHADSTSNHSNIIPEEPSDSNLEETAINTEDDDSRMGKAFHSYEKDGGTSPIATPVIAQKSSIKEALTGGTDSSTSVTRTDPLTVISESGNIEHSKTTERVQSVLVTASTANGPMLAHTPPRYRKTSNATVVNTELENKEFLHNGEKSNNNETKQFEGNTQFFQNKTKVKHNNSQRLDREMHQLCLQRKQAALERELRLQKSLSEECEDLGVDEPSTSDLFPEAEILFDANHSPSYDQTSQDLKKDEDVKNKSVGLTLFSDDDNSGSLRTDFLFDAVAENVDYNNQHNHHHHQKHQDKTNDIVIEYVEQQQQQQQEQRNGNGNGTSDSNIKNINSECDDQTLLPNCAVSISDVTLNSPVGYHENAPPPSLNKYKFKYSNRRRDERHKQQQNEQKDNEVWMTTVEVANNSGDLPDTTEVRKTPQHEDELSDECSYKVVTVAISSKNHCDEESCGDDEMDSSSTSGRGARRSVKKTCSCCNGSQEGSDGSASGDCSSGSSRKRPASRPQTPAMHKKAFLNKKR